MSSVQNSSQVLKSNSVPTEGTDTKVKENDRTSMSLFTRIKDAFKTLIAKSSREKKVQSPNTFSSNNAIQKIQSDVKKILGYQLISLGISEKNNPADITDDIFDQLVRDLQTIDQAIGGDTIFTEQTLKRSIIEAFFREDGPCPFKSLDVDEEKKTLLLKSLGNDKECKELAGLRQALEYQGGIEGLAEKLKEFGSDSSSKNWFLTFYLGPIGISPTSSWTEKQKQEFCTSITDESPVELKAIKDYISGENKEFQTLIDKLSGAIRGNQDLTKVLEAMNKDFNTFRDISNNCCSFSHTDVFTAQMKMRVSDLLSVYNKHKKEAESEQDSTKAEKAQRQKEEALNELQKYLTTCQERFKLYSSITTTWEELKKHDDVRDTVDQILKALQDPNVDSTLRNKSLEPMRHLNKILMYVKEGMDNEPKVNLLEDVGSHDVIAARRNIQISLLKELFVDLKNFNDETIRGFLEALNKQHKFPSLTFAISELKDLTSIGGIDSKEIKATIESYLNPPEGFNGRLSDLYLPTPGTTQVLNPGTSATNAGAVNSESASVETSSAVAPLQAKTNPMLRTVREQEEISTNIPNVPGQRKLSFRERMQEKKLLKRSDFDFLVEIQNYETDKLTPALKEGLEKIIDGLKSPYDILKLFYSNPEVQHTEALAFARVLSDCAQKIDKKDVLDTITEPFERTMAQVQFVPLLKILFEFLDFRKADPKYKLSPEEIKIPSSDDSKLITSQGIGIISSLVSDGEYTEIDKAIEYLRKYNVFSNWQKPPETSAPQNPATQS